MPRTYAFREYTMVLRAHEDSPVLRVNALARIVHCTSFDADTVQQLLYGDDFLVIFLHELNVESFPVSGNSTFRIEESSQIHNPLLLCSEPQWVEFEIQFRRHCLQNIQIPRFPLTVYPRTDVNRLKQIMNHTKPFFISLHNTHAVPLIQRSVVHRAVHIGENF